MDFFMFMTASIENFPLVFKINFNICMKAMLMKQSQVVGTVSNYPNQTPLIME